MVVWRVLLTFFLSADRPSVPSFCVRYLSVCEAIKNQGHKEEMMLKSCHCDYYSCGVMSIAVSMSASCVRAELYKTGGGASSFLPSTTFDRINVLIYTHSLPPFLCLFLHPMPANWMVSPLARLFFLSLAIYTKDNNLNTKEPLSPFLELCFLYFCECRSVPSYAVGTRNYLRFFLSSFCVSFSAHFERYNLMTERPPPLQTEQRPAYNRKRPSNVFVCVYFKLYSICCNSWHGSKTPWHLNSQRLIKLFSK